MNGNKLLVLVALVVVVLIGMATAPRAQNHDAGHAAHHDVYQTWSIPGTTVSCCNEKKTVDGVSTGDCYAVQAELRPSADPKLKHRVWWAKLDTGLWVEIPDNRILNNEKNPDPTGVSAHVCVSAFDDAILCFREPVGGT